MPIQPLTAQLHSGEVSADGSRRIAIQIPVASVGTISTAKPSLNVLAADQESQIARLSETVSELAGLLEPLLGPESQNRAGVGRLGEPLSPLGQTISDNIQSIMTLDIEVRELIARLQL